MENNSDFKLEDLLEPNKCNTCGEIIPRKALYCPHCGNEIKKEIIKHKTIYTFNESTSFDNKIKENVKPINKWLSFFLCFFFGFFGFHKFYEGNIKMGVIYFFTVGLFGFGWLYDLFVILFKPNPYYITKK